MPLPGCGRSGLIIRHPGSVLAVAAMTVALFAPPLVTYEAAWEVAAALGYVAAAAAVLCELTRPGTGAALTAYRFTLHRAAGDALLLLGLLHVAVMVAADPFMLDYLGWMMPLHVLVGVAAIVLLAMVVLGREPALWARPRWLGGVGFHAWAGLAGALLLVLHVLLSSTRLTATWRFLLVGAALGLPPVFTAAMRMAGRRARGQTWPVRGATRSRAVRAVLVAVVALLVAFLGVPGVVALWRG